MKQLTDFDEIWYEYYAFERSLGVVRFNYLRLVTGTWRKRELVRLELHFMEGHEMISAYLGKTCDFVGVIFV
jgi:hypothetical protein